MKRMLLAIMAVAVAISFSAPSFAGEEKKEKKDEKKGGHVLVYGEEKKDKKDEKKGGHMDTFGDKKKDEEGGSQEAQVNSFLARLAGLRSLPSKADGSLSTQVIFHHSPTAIPQLFSHLGSFRLQSS